MLKMEDQELLCAFNLVAKELFGYIRCGYRTTSKIFAGVLLLPVEEVKTTFSKRASESSPVLICILHLQCRNSNRRLYLQVLSKRELKFLDCKASIVRRT